MSTTMTPGEGASFLAQAHVGVLGVADADGRGPLLTPIWYHYQPGGEVTILTERDSRKARLIRRAGRFSLCAQQDQPPYMYVTVEGPVIGISSVPGLATSLPDARSTSNRTGSSPRAIRTPRPSLASEASEYHA